jgi:hypothetical protein
MLLEVEYRRFDVLRGGKGPVALRATFMESTAVAQVEPPNLEMTRAGRRFLLGNSAAITGIAPVQALPTTTAQWCIWNGEPANGKSYFFEELLMYLTSGTPGIGGVLLGCIFQTPAPVGGNTAGISVSPAAGIAGPSGSSQKSNAIVKSSPSAITTPAAPNWYEIASRSDAYAATAFAGNIFLENRNLQGAIALPPQTGLGLAVVSPAGTTPLYAPMARWIEAEVDME